MRRRFLLVGLASFTCVFLVMWLSSYHFYTSVGIDTEEARGAQIRCKYYRFRWPGDGSFRIGTVVLLESNSGRPLDTFDLGGRFFQPGRPSFPQSVWNRLGFWWIDAQSTDESWMGMPSWLPPLLSGTTAVWIARTSRRSRQQP